MLSKIITLTVNIFEYNIYIFMVLFLAVNVLENNISNWNLKHKIVNKETCTIGIPHISFQIQNLNLYYKLHLLFSNIILQ